MRLFGCPRLRHFALAAVAMPPKKRQKLEHRVVDQMDAQNAMMREMIGVMRALIHLSADMISIALRENARPPAPGGPPPGGPAPSPGGGPGGPPPPPGGGPAGLTLSDK